MRQLVVNMKTGFGKLRDESREYTVLRTDGLWNFYYQDYSQKYLMTAWVAENKKRFSTIQKYAQQYEIELIEG